MAVEVRQPQKRDDIGTALQVAKLGSSVLSGDVLGAASNAYDLMGSQQKGSSAIERRMQGAPTMPQVDDPMKALEDARFALASQPAEIQQQYQPAIQAALLKARREQGVA